MNLYINKKNEILNKEAGFIWEYINRFDFNFLKALLITSENKFYFLLFFSIN